MIKLVLFLLKHKKVSMADRHKLLNGVLDKLAALPVHDIIQVSESGSLIVNGKVLSVEELGLLRESAKNALQSRALGLVQDQVLFTAFTFGINTSTNFDQIYFSKAAIWWGQQQHKLLKLLANVNDEERDLIP